MKIAAAQINPTIGDIQGNVDKILQYIGRAKELGAQLVVFPELSLTGYPPRDLVEKESFLERSECELQRLARETADQPIALICGYVGKSPDGAGKRATNSAAILQRGQVVFRQVKMLLPTYDVFDEARYFLPGDSPHLTTLDGRNLSSQSERSSMAGQPKPAFYVVVGLVVVSLIGLVIASFTANRELGERAKGGIAVSVFSVALLYLGVAAANYAGHLFS